MESHPGQPRPGGRASFHLLKDDGGGLTISAAMESHISEKIIAASPIPASAGEERDSDKRTMGVGSSVPIQTEKYRCRIYTPALAAGTPPAWRRRSSLIGSRHL